MYHFLVHRVLGLVETPRSHVRDPASAASVFMHLQNRSPFQIFQIFCSKLDFQKAQSVPRVHFLICEVF